MYFEPFCLFLYTCLCTAYCTCQASLLGEVVIMAALCDIYISLKEHNIFLLIIFSPIQFLLEQHCSLSLSLSLSLSHTALYITDYIALYL